MDPKVRCSTLGTLLRELAGHDDLLSKAEVALHRVKNGRPARGRFLLGPRGVGKTALLYRIAGLAEELGCSTIVLDAHEGDRLAEILVPPLRSLLSKLSRSEPAGAKEVIAPGIPEHDLPELFLALGQAAKAEAEPVVILVDEIQSFKIDELGALISSMHRIAQQNLPVILFGAGPPQLAALAGEARAYAESLFEYREVGAEEG